MTWLLLASLPVGATSLSGQKTKGLKKGANVSLNVTNKKKNPHQTYFNFGLLSNFSSLNGAGINLISSIVPQNVKGVQLSGFLNISGLNASGLQLAGVANLAGKDANGMSLAGLMNISGKSTRGIQISGLGNITGQNLNGVAVSGLVNITGDNSNGMQVAGLANITSENHNGLAIGGLMNAAAKNSNGLQLTALLNIAGNENRGVQLAGLGNVNVKNKGVQFSFLNYSAQNNGLQLGIGNIANQGDRGVQLGLVNVSADKKTHQIGCINIKPDTRTQMILSGGNSSKFNLAVRFKNRFAYTQLGTGVYHLGLDRDFSLSGFYRAGVYYPLTSRLDVSADLGYYHIESFDNKHQGYPARLYAIQPRINLEYAITPRFGLTASGGYEWLRGYKGAGKIDNKAVFEIGIVLF